VAVPLVSCTPGVSFPDCGKIKLDCKNMPENNQGSRTSLILTLITAGVFLVGAAVFPLLVRGQETVLENSGVTLPPVIVNRTAPQLALTDLQGNPVSLSGIHGKVLLVNNWATWCPPCLTELPELQAYYQAHVNQDFILIGIESGGTAEEVSSFVRKHGLTFPIWLDSHGAALDSFQNWDLPSSYVVDRQGTLRFSWTGPINQATLEKYVTPLLGVTYK
jgi:peroxiredoxin